jgi:hypothetical protein
MKSFGSVLAAAILAALLSSPASARPVKISGAAADAFIAKYFPNASIPGPVSGRFRYLDRHGRPHFGRASCYVPAMGGRSEGEVSTCTVRY